MLKHVHASSSSLSPYRLKSPSRDTVSLTSSLSYGSSGGQEPLSSRSSSTSSLHDTAIRPQKMDVDSWDSLLHFKGCSTSGSFGAFKLPCIPDVEVISKNSHFLTTVKVFSKVLCADMEYKTLSIGQQTTSKDVVRMLLGKFKMKHRDPNLFYLTMEVWMRKKGIPIRSVMILEDEAHPAELQACHPRGESKFSLKMRRGGLVKVFGGSCLMAGSLYKSLLVSDRTSVDELIQLILHCYNSTERSSKFALYEVCTTKNYERKLHSNDLPLQIQQEWPSSEHFAFHLRRNIEALQRRGWLGSSASLCFRLYV